MQQSATATKPLTFVDLDHYLRDQGYKRADIGSRQVYRHAATSHRVPVSDTENTSSKALTGPAVKRLAEALGFRSAGDLRLAIATDAPPPIVTALTNAAGNGHADYPAPAPVTVPMEHSPVSIASLDTAPAPFGLPLDADGALDMDELLAGLLEDGLVSPPTSAYRIITPDQALDYITNAQFPRQRPLSALVVQRYAHMMRTRKWRISTIKIAVVDGKDILLDGHHRMHSCVEAEMPIRVMAERYEFKELTDSIRQYIVTDQGKIRNMGNIIRAAGTAEEIGVPQSFLKNCGAAQPIIEARFGQVRRQGDVLINSQSRLEWLHDWSDDIRAYYACLSGTRKTAYHRLASASVIAVALVTLRHDRDNAVQFWTAVADNDGLRRRSPEGVLVAWMQDHTVHEYRVDVYSKYVARAWKAYIEGRELSTLVVKDGDLPIDLPNTPYTRTRRGSVVADIVDAANEA